MRDNVEGWGRGQHLGKGGSRAADGCSGGIRFPKVAAQLTHCPSLRDPTLDEEAVFRDADPRSWEHISCGVRAYMHMCTCMQTQVLHVVVCAPECTSVWMCTRVV